jgi:hypothetical protein
LEPLLGRGSWKGHVLEGLANFQSTLASIIDYGLQ